MSLVRDAVRGQRQQNGEDFDEMLHCFKAPHPPKACELVQRLVQTLRHNTDELQFPAHSDLVVAIFEMDWAELPRPLLAEVAEFIMGLVSLRTHFLDITIQRIFIKFKTTPPDATNGAQGLARRCNELHELLQELCSRFPTGLELVCQLFEAVFPHKREERAVQINFLHNALLFTDNCPAILDRVVSHSVFRLKEIDVDIKPEEVPDAEEDGEEVHLQFQMEALEVDREHAKQRELANSLDQMMLIMFNFIDTRQRSEHVFQAMLAAFERHLLHTHRSKYCQFLMFYACHFSAKWTEKWLTDLLWTLIDDKHGEQPRTTRMACAGYIGSLLARANYISIDQVKVSLQVLCKWCGSYVRANPTVTVLDVEVHGVFYATCQAVLYLMCYRFDELAADQPFLTDLQLDIALLDPGLNPLQVTQSHIHDEFIKLCRRYEWSLGDALADLVAQNSGKILPSRNSSGISNELDKHCFFPFDPYLLAESARYIESLWTEWRGDEDDDDEDEFDEDDDEQSPNLAKGRASQKRGTRRRLSTTSSVSSSVGSELMATSTDGSVLTPGPSQLAPSSLMSSTPSSVTDSLPMSMESSMFGSLAQTRRGVY